MARTNFENLRVYQLAEKLADAVWEVVRGWDQLAKDTVGKQLVRAADSVGANIAEGTGRGSHQDNRRFVRIARGSLYETQHWLRRAYRRNLLAEKQTAMIHRQSLLSDLQRLLRQLEADLRARCDEVAEVGAAVRAEYDAAREAERTAQTFEEWRGDYITQIAAAWVLSCVFARFLEDNELVDPPRIAGPGKRLRRARDEHELYFRTHPRETDREYLLFVFDELARLPGGRDIFGEHNAVNQQRGWLSCDGARDLLSFFQRIDAASGELVHDFTDPEWDTRFLGDLYQDLSEAARKKYALLQTPEFVEEFILDRTLDPAIDEFGLDGSSFLVLGSSQQDQPPPAKNQEQRTKNSFRMIDPACGSGHFLLGSLAGCSTVGARPSRARTSGSWSSGPWIRPPPARPGRRRVLRQDPRGDRRLGRPAAGASVRLHAGTGPVAQTVAQRRRP